MSFDALLALQRRNVSPLVGQPVCALAARGDFRHTGKKMLEESLGTCFLKREKGESLEGRLLRDGKMSGCH